MKGCVSEHEKSLTDFCKAFRRIESRARQSLSRGKPFVCARGWRIQNMQGE